MSAENPLANGHVWPCSGFYVGNHHPLRAGQWTCSCSWHSQDCDVSKWRALPTAGLATPGCTCDPIPYPSPVVVKYLRDKLVEGLVRDGVPSEPAEEMAEEVIAFARERGRALRAHREHLQRVFPPGLPTQPTDVVPPRLTRWSHFSWSTSHVPRVVADLKAQVVPVAPPTAPKTLDEVCADPKVQAVRDALNLGVGGGL